METMKTRKNKFLVILIVFMMLFSNFGYTIAAIATSDEFEVITKGFFQKDEVKFNAYFEDEDGNKITEITKNVNEKMKLVIEVLPQVEGYLKSGTIKAVSSNDDNINFKFTSVTENLLSDRNYQAALKDVFVNDSEVKEEEPTVPEEQPSINDVLVQEPEGNVVDTDSTNTELQNTVDTNEVAGTDNTSAFQSVLSNEEQTNPFASALEIQGTSTNETDTNTVASNPFLDVLETNTSVEDTKSTEPVVPDVEPVQDQTENPVQESIEDQTVSEDTLVNEEEIIKEKTEESRLNEEIRNAILDIKLVSENEISLSNIIDDTKIEIELEYNQSETFNIEDLLKDIKLQMSGIYINRNLEEVKVGKEEEITIGWEYTKDISLESEYTKFSPFELQEIHGTIVENKITVTRDIQDEKYLPVKSTRLEIVVPEVNGKKPIAVDVLASKLLATKGEDSGYVTFESTNWNYDDVNGLINVFVENDNNVYSSGSDEYVIIYRYEDYISSENSNLSKNVKATVTEYSGTTNNTLIKEIKESQEIKVDVGELVTYSVGTNEDALNKGRIYANYNSENALYETIFTNQVNVNVLTSDVLQQLKLDCSKDVYKDANGVELPAQGIEYKEIKFNFSEISSILSDGGEIVITNSANETLYILNKDAITKEEDCTIGLNGANGIYVYVNNISKNGAINFEITKAIKKCNYDKSIFKGITQIESRISGEVKYLNIEDRLALQTIAISKNFEESKTQATLAISRTSLSTISSNENVELKIELNNDKETSDLYINPSFEVVFPKYVKEVSIESINLLNDCGLKVSDFETYTESDLVKMRIELSGTQTTFSENSITNGTNIIVNANIEVDNYAPAKEDQVKLYYCNEGVATYQAQTKWSLNKKSIPNGILKTTNGFDVEVIKYQAPTGLLAINGIVNYDGNLSEVRSVKQGEVAKEIPINSPSRIATMELLALNNTGNSCSDVILLGRIPFKGNKDVISEEDLGTTTTTRMVDSIKEDVKNANTVEIYYSANENANKDLNNESNGWVTTVEDLSTVRSYMIVVKGDVEAGSVLRYTYDFEIPENLPYEAKITGAFAAYYNNQKEEAVVYESSSADKVVLTTGVGPKIEAKLSVDVGDGADVGEARFLNYTLKVMNTGSVDATDINISVKKSPYTDIYEYDSETVGVGNNNYVQTGKAEQTWKVDKLVAGETKEFKYMLKTIPIKTYEDYKNGMNMIITSKAVVSANNLGITIESNETSNKIVESNLDLGINTVSYAGSGKPLVGNKLEYNIFATNIAEKDLNDIKVLIKLPFEVKYKDIEIMMANYDENTLVYDESTNTISFTIASIKAGQGAQITIETTVVKGSDDEMNAYATFDINGEKQERTTDCPLIFIGPVIEVTQVTNVKSVKEGEYTEFGIQIVNKGNGRSSSLKISDEISEYLKNATAEYSGNSNGKLILKDNKIDDTIASIGPKGKVVLRISGIAGDLKEGLKEDVITNKAIITGDYIEDIDTGIASIDLKENPDKKEDNNNTSDNNQDPVNDNNSNSDNNNQEPINNDNSNSDNNSQEPINNNNSNSGNNGQEPTTNSGNASNNNGEPIKDNSSDNNKNNTNTNSNTNPDNATNAKVNTFQNDSKVKTDSDESTESENKYSINGKIWFDLNKDGKMDQEEERLSTIQVQLLKDRRMIKVVTSDGNGEYKFDELKPGKYNIVFSYDGNRYTTTQYLKQDVSEEFNSNVIEAEEGMAVAEDLEIAESNIENINLGLIERDTFDLTIEKYISKTRITTEKGTRETDFDNEKLIKLEIRSKEIENAIVDLEYKFIIENKGSTKGNALRIVDRIPEGMTFDQNKNEGWYIGNDGYLYNETLKDREIKPGEKIELKLVASKQMNSENTGVVSNKVIIQETLNGNGLKDNANNNVSTQEVIITIGTGRTVQTIIITIVISMLVILCLNIKKITVNKRYNNSKKHGKIKTKKVYR